MTFAGVAYLDSSAIVKLVLDEPESIAFRAWAGGRTTATSLLGVTEVLRAVRLHEPSSLPAALAAVECIVRLPLDSGIVAAAVEVDPPALRSLDALHLASALALEDTVDAFVTYDRRLAAAASASGLRVVVPR